MDKKCFDCGKTLKRVPRGPSWMNDDQWDAIKAGDYYSKCDQSSRSNGCCYFWDSDGVGTLKRRPKSEERTNG